MRREQETLHDLPKLESYLKDLDLLPIELMDKSILDLGAGGRQFAYECERFGIPGVVSLDQSNESWMGILRAIAQAQAMRKHSDVLASWELVNAYTAQAEMQLLPFGDNTFDLVLSRHALMPIQFTDETSFLSAYRELVRIVKPGGEARIFPGLLEAWSKEQIEYAMKALSVLDQIRGLQVTRTEVKTHIFGMSVRGSLIILRKQ
ncbi:MAG TPA: class I SAM-dependent methyltransferase [Patescibacteria group bacterium]|nr:class I SAM-dependent methyltransferase [Patescibacteria group bacterium]